MWASDLRTRLRGDGCRSPIQPARGPMGHIAGGDRSASAGCSGGSATGQWTQGSSISRGTGGAWSVGEGSEAQPARRTRSEFCLRPDFVAGVRLLETFGFSFDICVRHNQLPAVTALVRECPTVTFVLDHLAKPSIRERQLDPWRGQLAALGELPNVACKLSGLVTEADWQQWRPEDLALYVTHALDVFGPSRVLFGSDWPVMTLASSYRRWVETLDELTSHLSAEDRQRLWSENACHWYRLPLPVHE